MVFMAQTCKTCVYWDDEDQRNGKCWCRFHDATDIFTSPNGKCTGYINRIRPLDKDENKAFQFTGLQIRLRRQYKMIKKSTMDDCQFKDEPLDIMATLSNAFASLRRHGNTKMAGVWRDRHGVLKRHRIGRKGFKWFMVAKVVGDHVYILIYSNNAKECANWLMNYFRTRDILGKCSYMGLEKAYRLFYDDNEPPAACFFIQSQRIGRNDINGYQATKQGIIAFLHESVKTKGSFVEEVTQEELEDNGDMIDDGNEEQDHE